MTTDTRSYLLNTPEALGKEKSRLAIQANALFDIEKPILKSFCRGKIDTLLDLGCGNAFYTSQLKSLFEIRNTYGYERNQDLIEHAKIEFPNINIAQGDLTNNQGIETILAETKPDLINLRFVLQHMRPSERSNLLSTLNRGMKPGSKLIVTEPNDSEILITPNSDNLNYLIKRTIEIQAERGGDRNIACKLESELMTAGFKNIEKRKYSISNRNISFSLIVDIIMPIWRSYRSGEPRESLDARITETKTWLEEQNRSGLLDVDFPIYIFEAKTSSAVQSE